MKKFILVWFVAVMTAGCESEGPLTVIEVGALPVPEEAIAVYSGVFSSTQGINVSGSVKIYRQQSHYYAALKSFSVSSGPDLKVYLSTSAAPDQFLNLGALGNGPEQAYAIPDGTDFTQYCHVLIHCQQYNHLFAIAPLSPVN